MSNPRLRNAPVRRWAAGLLCVILAAANAKSDWDPVDSAKWVQLPDLTTNGIDVMDFKWGNLPLSSRTLADDWRCTVTEPITNIHIWGSWCHDEWPQDYAQSLAFVLAIRADIPAAQSPTGYSMPGTLLWTQTFAPGTFATRLYAMMTEGFEGWFEPGESPYYEAYGDLFCWQYNFPVSKQNPFTQEGSPAAPVVYWLEVQAVYPVDVALTKSGWKTSFNHWNDSAVYAKGFAPDASGNWKQLLYPDGHPLEGQPIDLSFVINGGVGDYDFGDAPDPGYPTLLANNGARHQLTSQGPYLGPAGDQPDPEADGQPDASATGDDLAGASPDDEDGAILPALQIGVPTAITVTVGQPGWVDGWIDWNGDGVWQDPAERVVGAVLPAGPNPVGVTAPGPFTGQTFARFRIHTGTAALLPTGLASDGEVEDHLVSIEPPPVLPDPQAKWWQTPDLTTNGLDVFGTYPLLLADDFLCTNRMAITNIVLWGSWRKDVLPPGGPASPTFFLSFHRDIPAGPGGADHSMPGEPLWWWAFPPASYSVEIEQAGLQEGWFNPDPAAGEYLPWSEPGDTVCYRYTFPVPLGNEFVQTGTVRNPIVYWLDLQAMPGEPSAAQFGWKTSASHWNDDAAYALGEEPYAGTWPELRYPLTHPLEGVSIDLAFALYGDPVEPPPGMDLGDAPDPSYPTLLASNGARHALSSLFLGQLIDTEPDGQPTVGANGDDLAGLADEDGVVFVGMPWIPAGGGAATCTCSGPGFLDAWIDFNQDGDWNEANEQIVFSVPVSGGVNAIGFPIPGGALSGATYARFRLSGSGGLSYAGAAPDGEVEDYLVGIGEPLIDFGDAPDSPTAAGYPTLLSSNGARHYLRGTLFMGVQADSEADGQPTGTANGDDAAGADDEDGVAFLTPFCRGETAMMQVSVTAAGCLDAWIDLNADSDWSDPGEQMAASLTVTAGVNAVSFVVPGTATKGATFARFRLSSAGGLAPAGLADDGEVEDEPVTISDRFPPIVGPKWLQPPDLRFGIDIPSWGYEHEYGPDLVADDWWCDGRPIDAIRWWGSYLAYGGVSNAPGIPVGGLRPMGFRLHWYTDVPATNSPAGYSTPGPELLTRDFLLLSYTQPLNAYGVVKEFYAGTVDLSFLGGSYAGRMEHKFRYDLYLEDSWNEKAGRIYWLGVEALYGGEPRIYPWGWSTTPVLYNWNDDAVVRTNDMTGLPVWGEMTYLPAVPPYNTLETHPYLGRSVNMAYQLLSRVTPRRAYIWRQPPDMTNGTDLASWRSDPMPPGYSPTVRADDWLAEGRRVSNVHWWGSYLNWQHTTPGSELEPVFPPTPGGVNCPTGFKLSWHAAGLMQPGAAVTNLFVPLEYCHQTYYCCVTQFWAGAGVYEHEYQYYVDLLDPRVSGVPWNVASNTWYWLDIQAVFASGVQFSEWGHTGWGWKTTPELQGNGSAVATNSAPFFWEPGVYPGRHPLAGQPADLAFELTTDRVGTNRWHSAPMIVAIVLPTNAPGTVLVAGVGDALAGEQQLRMETVLTNAAFATTADTRPAPFPPPATNWFYTAAATNLWEFYRIFQLTP